MTQIIKLNDAQVTENPFITHDGKSAFYNLIEQLCAKENKTVKSIDCTKINIAQNIQTSWYDYAKAHNIDTTDLTISLLFAGPKALENIPDNTVEVLDNCITYEDINTSEYD